MAIEKPLKIRDYLEPRIAAGPRSRAASNASGSFLEVLKTEKQNSAAGVAAGKKISDYLRNPLLMAYARRSEELVEAPRDAALGLQATAFEKNDKNRIAAARMNSNVSALADFAAGRRSGRLASSGSSGLGAYSAVNNRVEESIQRAAAKYNLTPELLRSVIRAESNFQVDAVSPAGAKGLMQLMPETAKELGVANVFDIQQNIDGGARYLRQMLDRFGGDMKQALAAYNAGPGAVEQFNGHVPYPETRQYVRRVMRLAGLG
jgi:soluble lytic murein transglycosylase-like protein